MQEPWGVGEPATGALCPQVKFTRAQFFFFFSLTLLHSLGLGIQDSPGFLHFRLGVGETVRETEALLTPSHSDPS